MAKSGLEFSNLVGCEIKEWLMTYLVIPLKANPKTKSFWDPVAECVSIHLDSWKGGLFSILVAAFPSQRLVLLVSLFIIYL